MTENHPRPWISVEERLPEDWVDVLCLSDKGIVATAYCTTFMHGRRWISKDCEGAISTAYPTHWMPLPAPPA